ncbi:hypothetical protein B5X24_HaOG211572 [Helicoverpa armigera]|nr:hypothetical protein B5X24_HaOG211572 [Helicoverpa armigera]
MRTALNFLVRRAARWRDLRKMPNNLRSTLANEVPILISSKQFWGTICIMLALVLVSYFEFNVGFRTFQKERSN